MKKLCVLLTLLLFCFAKAKGQQFYITSSTGIQSINIQNGVPATQNITSCSAPKSYSIAMHGSTFYYFTGFGNGSQVFKGTLSGNTISNCTLIATIPLVNPSALTVDNDGILYYAQGTTLYKIDSNNPTPVTLGTMPYTSGGDLAFYNTDLYLASPTAIVKINLADPSQSTPYVTFPNLGAGSLYGLTAVNINGTVSFYAFDVNGSQTIVYNVDMANQKILGVVCTLPYIIYDAASLSEGGTTSTIKITSANITQICNLNNQAQVQITATPDAANTTLTYTLNNASNTTGTFTPLLPGSYPLNIKSSSGVQKDTTIVVPDYTFDKSKMNISKTNPVCNLAGKIEFTVPNSNLYTIQYNTSSFAADHSFTGLTPGSYDFTIINSGGCPVDTVNVTLSQDICYPQITFPNTFTPNNDGINDVFEPNQDGTASNYTLKIYNRWGTVIFISTDVHTGWNGQYKGKSAAIGTYYWTATYTDGYGKKNSQSGSATLIR